MEFSSTTSVELKVYFILYAVHKLYLLLPVLSRHIDHLVGSRLVLSLSSCSHVISGQFTKAFPLTPSGYKMTAKTVAWRVLLHPPATSCLYTVFTVHISHGSASVFGIFVGIFFKFVSVFGYWTLNIAISVLVFS